jgi:hypothetical protein
VKQSNNGLIALYKNKKCAWPNCEFTKNNPEFIFDSFHSFLKSHLIKEHRIDQNALRDILFQIRVLNELDLQNFSQKMTLSGMLDFQKREIKTILDYNPFERGHFLY